MGRNESNQTNKQTKYTKDISKGLSPNAFRMGKPLYKHIIYDRNINPLLHNIAFERFRNIMYLKILRKMEHLLQKSKCSIFHNIFKSIQNLT